MSTSCGGLAATYDLLPFRFARLPGDDRLLLTSEAGEYSFLDSHQFDALVHRRPLARELADDLEAIQILRRDEAELPIRLLATKLRTRKSFLRGGPKLHIFVVTLRCDHTCRYCQVSRAADTSSRSDMTEDTARRAVDRLFDARSDDLTVEFQGGEPLLAFERIRFIVEAIERRRLTEPRRINYTLTSTLHHLSSEILGFLKQHGFHVSTSLDGPAGLHDANRPLPGRQSHQRTLEGVDRLREALGPDRLCALTTLTAASLEHPEAIIDEYVRLGFSSIFLHPLSNFGFAAKAGRRIGYDIDQYLAFFERALDYILQLNSRGTAIVEVYTALLLGSILTPFPTGYVDLRSSVGGGLGTLVDKDDGGVYASDEGRMLAEMGNHALRLGAVGDDYRTLMNSGAMHLLAAAGLAEALPGCADCAFVHYCGPDPAASLAATGDPIAHNAFSDHCRRHTGLFNAIFKRLAEGDSQTRRVFNEWAFGRPALEAA